MEMKLNVYDENGNISKTYAASEFDLMWGTVEDLVDCIDIDKDDFTSTTTIKTASETDLSWFGRFRNSLHESERTDSYFYECVYICISRNQFSW